MATFITDKVGKFVSVDLVRDLEKVFATEEGTIKQYYGRVGNGKTYAATADILRDLSRGEVVYANWKVKFDGYDQRDHLWWIMMGLFGKKLYYKFDDKNFHYLPIDDKFLDVFETLTDCKVYLDEGHLVFDSYEMTRMSLQKRAAVLHTRHFNRTLNIISQRPTAIHASARANVNIFYKCEKVRFLSKWWPIFIRKEYQDLKDESVNEEEKPISKRWYFGNPHVFAAYDSKYMRGEVERSQSIFVGIYKLSYWDRIKILLIYFLPERWKEMKQPAAASAAPASQDRSIRRVEVSEGT